MPNNTITQPHAKGATPNAIVKLTTSDFEPKDGAFLREWAKILGVSILLKRMLVAAAIGQQYVEKMPESGDSLMRTRATAHEARAPVLVTLQQRVTSQRTAIKFPSDSADDFGNSNPDSNALTDTGEI